MSRFELHFLDRKAVRVSLLVLGIALFMGLGVTSYLQKSITFDEEHHILRGWVPLETGDFMYNQYHPPLVNMIAALPVALNPAFKLPSDYNLFSGPKVKLLSFLILWKMGNDAEQIINSSRFMIMMLGALLSLTVYFWAKHLYGNRAGLFAFFLCLMSPNIMAHARLVTTDLGVTFFFFLASFTFYLWLQKKESKVRYVLAGLAIGLAQLSKFSAIAIFPPIFIAILYQNCLENDDDDKGGGRFISAMILSFLQFGGLLAICYAVIIAGYGFQPGAYFKNFFKAGETIVFQEQSYYFRGEIGKGKIWYLPLVAMLIKTPIPILLLTVIGLLSTFFKKPEKRELLTVFLIPLFFLLIILMPEKNSQLRYYLPLYPFLFLFAARIIPFVQNLWKKTAVLLLSVWLILTQWMIYPDYLTYFNEAAGGPKNGYKWLLDSNYDWGQDLKQLKRYMDEKGIEKISLSYFGRALADYYDIDYEVLPSSFLSSLPWYDDTGVMPVPQGWVAVSANHLMGFYLMPKYRNYYEGLREIEPTARIGNSIFVYYLVPRRPGEN